MPSPADFSQELAARLKDAQAWLVTAHDRELGLIGPRISQAFNRAAARERANTTMRINASFRSYVWPPKAGERGFQNIINYGPPALDHMGRLFAARVHEYIHALQYRRAAALHADPFNDIAQEVVHPLAYVQRKERLEQDAYAKGAWIQSLVQDLHPDMRTALDRTPIGVGDFEELRAQGGALETVVARAARQAAQCPGFWLHSDSKHPARDLWHRLALEEYDGILRARKKAGQLPTRYIRLAARDLVAIGDTLGVNPFKADRGLATALPEMSDDNRKFLAQIEKTYGIPAYDSLPTLTDALAARGQQPRQLIAASRRYRAPQV